MCAFWLKTIGPSQRFATECVFDSFQEYEAEKQTLRLRRVRMSPGFVFLSARVRAQFMRLLLMNQRDGGAAEYSAVPCGTSIELGLLPVPAAIPDR